MTGTSGRRRPRDRSYSGGQVPSVGFFHQPDLVSFDLSVVCGAMVAVTSFIASQTMKSYNSCGWAHTASSDSDPFIGCAALSVYYRTNSLTAPTAGGPRHQSEFSKFL